MPSRFGLSVVGAEFRNLGVQMGRRNVRFSKEIRRSAADSLAKTDRIGEC